MSGSLIDLDPPPARERRWPFYVGWAIGGLAVGAVLVSRAPASFTHGGTAGPAAAPPSAAAPATPQLGPRLHVAPADRAPVRP